MWAQTVIASLFALVAFIVMLSIGVGGGQPIEIQTKVYDVLQAAVAVIATLSGSWTPLISNDSGTISVGGATIAYGAWFYLVAGNRRVVLARRGGHLLSRQCHLGACCRHYPTGQSGNDINQQDTRASDSAAALNREALVRALSGLIGRRGGFTMSIVAWVTLTVPVCLARTRFVAPCRWSAISPTTAR